MTRPTRVAGSPGLSSFTSGYTGGLQRGSASGSARTSKTSSAVPLTRQVVKNAYTAAISLVLQVGRVQQLLPRALDLLPRAHDLDQLLPPLRGADHDRAHEPVVLEEELPVELFLEAERAHRLQAGLHVRSHAHHRQG